MTTLPQTTNVRLPQPAPGTAPVAYVPSAPALPPGMTGADIWRVVRANFWLMLIMVLLFGAGGYLLNSLWAARWPRYTAVGYLQLRTTTPGRPMDPNTDHEIADQRLITELRTQAQLLQQDSLFSEALKRDEIRNTDWFKKRTIPEAKESLRDYFRPSPVPDSTLLAVRMTTANPRDARTIVTEIVNEHLSQQRKVAENRVAARTKTLLELRDQYKTMIESTHKRVIQRQGELTKRGIGGGNFGVVSTREAELTALVQNELKISEDANIAASNYQRVMALEKSGQEIPEVEKAVDGDPTVMSLARNLADAEIQLKVNRAQRGDQHPEVARIKAMVDATRAKLDEQKASLRANYRVQFLSALEGQQKQTQASLETIHKQINGMRDELSDLSKEIGLFLTDQDEEKALRELYQQYNNRYSEITLAESPENQARIDWAPLGAPEVPDIPTWPKLWVLLPMSILLGLGLALGIAFLREYLDDTVRSPRDISRVGQMNVLGIVADAEEDPQVANAKLPIFDAPHSITAEQFRQIRTRLQHVAGLDTNRSIMVTGPSPLDGKTTIAANLAAALALNGRKTLLVDANVRRPEIHRLFGVGNEKGFSDVLNGTLAFDEALRPTRVPNLTVMTSGPKPMNPTELFESQLLVDFIERALEEYDHVIFDSGPFLVVSEPVAMAPRVDGVITVVRAHAESRGLLQRMRDQLRQVKAEHLGVVVNAVRAQGGGYYRRNIKAFYNYNEA